MRVKQDTPAHLLAQEQGFMRGNLRRSRLLQTTLRFRPVSQGISEPEEWEPFRLILALAAGFSGTILINPDPSGSIFGNQQDISGPTIRSSALMDF